MLNFMNEILGLIQMFWTIVMTFVCYPLEYMVSDSPNLEGYMSRVSEQDVVREKQRDFLIWSSSAFERYPNHKIVFPVRGKMSNESIQKSVQQFRMPETWSFLPLKER